MGGEVTVYSGFSPIVDAVGGIDDISSKDRPGISMPRMGGMDIPPPNMLEDIIDELVELLENEELLEKEDFIMLLLDEEPPMDMPPMPDIILLIMSSIEGIIAPPPPNIGIFMSSIPGIPPPEEDIIVLEELEELEDLNDEIVLPSGD
jgi:hypothetical protein